MQEFHEMLGSSAAMQRVFQTVRKAAAHRTTVLIQGESGTGKELVARALHRASPRAERAFVPVNCGAIPESLIESELFGHSRGAFTDATADKAGLFEAADGGTIFLDEIGELPQALQVKLLRVLQEGTIRRLGDGRDRDVDVRVIAATVRKLADEVAEQRFREDLFYRLNVLSIEVPPLRERTDDIPLLIDHFLAQNNRRLGLTLQGVEAEARDRLMAYPWPGNVRELENLMERAAVLAEGDVIRVRDLPERVCEAQHPVIRLLHGDELSIKKVSRIIEETLIRRALERTGGNRTAAARLLEISHRTLLYKIKEYGLM